MLTPQQSAPAATTVSTSATAPASKAVLSIVSPAPILPPALSVSQATLSSHKTHKPSAPLALPHAEPAPKANPLLAFHAVQGSTFQAQHAHHAQLTATAAPLPVVFHALTATS
jgi:hypothetical protein